MSKPKDGGPVFPQEPEIVHGEPQFMQRGISLRDLFAAAALPELVRTALLLDHKSWDATAAHAYIIADAVLKERERQ